MPLRLREEPHGEAPMSAPLVGQKGARPCPFVSAVNEQSFRDAICPRRTAVPHPSSGKVLAEPSTLTLAAGVCNPAEWRWLAAYPRVARKELSSANNAASSRYRCEVGRVGVSHGCIAGARVQDSWGRIRASNVPTQRILDGSDHFACLGV